MGEEWIPVVWEIGAEKPEMIMVVHRVAVVHKASSEHLASIECSSSCLVRGTIELATCG